MTIPSAWSDSKIWCISRTRSIQSANVMAWLGIRRKGTSSTRATSDSSGRRSRNSPSASRFPASIYQARSSRSTPTESMVPPVTISATRGNSGIGNSPPDSWYVGIRLYAVTIPEDAERESRTRRIEQRKREHVELAAGDGIESGGQPGFGDVRLVHEALPETAPDQI